MKNNYNNNYQFNRNSIFKKNKRIYKRLKYNDTIIITSINGEKTNLKLQGINLSISGIGFVSRSKFEINDVLEVIFKYDKITIPAIVQVMHISIYDNGYFIGGQFVALHNTYIEILKQELS
ncbi:PilZ domain-containing protein [Clostridium pasteurianum DSM 525 = ATCC 6013]|uniref:PilZ domain-containing protein n=1 Tax=Clostridium pasteurianum DSM 525 = ATCC 6013 TaxID=1262449 RepID=A0A0H3J1R1_CLOPA|nr:PilZ domain-containing protein [Clostridium pasteurianum]AJA46642.1 PilZ domain-containing protein [Clostridium pasteurianum DSM 525 = ATCC 6013]AJA50630.1 PilZ domain-containing protein [Clostridium pasteurianum DSM 525 = ATCC 6013]AOZ74053.1 pilus assembly protein PilZ [Clostridium pasteurianum DSM 525 = ATCC 6013]AOZ77850.1 pilus assembly protein PilZ [Clostridium pasteurianum]ELP61207.1 hypothetical protein F502_02090 [Clostridium pasteurianum DSM 525 = ATCC 6013]